MGALYNSRQGRVVSLHKKYDEMMKKNFVDVLIDQGKGNKVSEPFYGQLPKSLVGKVIHMAIEEWTLKRNDQTITVIETGKKYGGRLEFQFD